MNLNLVFALIFYSLVIVLIYKYKHKFDFHAKIIALYRTKIGLKAMDKIAKFSPKIWKIWGYLGIVAGYLGLFFISYILVKGAFDLILFPEAPAAVTPVLPGIKIPGSPVFIPFWSGIISIFIVAFVHEFAHGIMARLYGMKVKSSGIFFLGPIIGAFVEPDEEKLKSSTKIQQLSVFAAGPFANICLGIIVLMLMVFFVVPIASSMVNPDGVIFTETVEGYPAQKAGIGSGALIKYADDTRIMNKENLTHILSNKRPGDELVLGDGDNNYTLTLASNPDNDSKAYMGAFLEQKYDIKKGHSKIFSNIMFYFIDFLRILFMLTMGIGFANLLPLGPVDGGRMLQVTLYKWFDKTKANKIWAKLSTLMLFILLFNLFYPMLRSIIF